MSLGHHLSETGALRRPACTRWPGMSDENELTALLMVLDWWSVVDDPQRWTKDAQVVAVVVASVR